MKTVRKKVITLCLALLGLSLLTNCSSINRSHIGAGGTKPDNSWKIEASKNFTIVPAYNKGPYMVVNKSDLKTAGRKV